MTAVAIQLQEFSVALYQGLCVTCANLPGCGFHRSANPVIHCEEFALNHEPTPRARHPAISAPNERDHDRFQGICVNCDARERCTFRVPDRAVWHCEEYR